MGRFATHEDEVDDLFRLGVFVDLYRVVRQGLRAGVESYSLKRLEPLVGYDRRVDLRDATSNLIAFESALEEGTAQDDRGTQAVVAGYNEDDCRSTLALRDWLEERRLELGGLLGAEPPRPAFAETAHAAEDPEVSRLKRELISGVPDDTDQRTEEQKAKVLLADLLDWHRREAKPAWWRYFRRKEMSSSDLVGERDAIGDLTGGDFVCNVKKSVVLRFSFPPQEHGFSPGDLALDPVSGKTWTVWGLDEKNGTIDLRIGAGSADVLPTAITEGAPISADAQAQRLRDVAKRVLRHGMTGTDPATALLLRLPPTGMGLGGGPVRRGESPGEGAVRVIAALDGSYLPIQGPPGAGKTYTAAHAILALTADGRTVGITGPSHAVIHNLISAVVDQAGKADRALTIGQRADPNNSYLHREALAMGYNQLIQGLRDHELDIVAGTAWLWARPEFDATVDTLVVDEAGQLSLANVLSVSGAGRNLVLMGDPQQLAQPSQAAHPPGADVSALGHILDVRSTLPEEAGIFLDRTYRMHPSLCAYTSEVFYDGRLSGVAGLGQQSVTGDGWILRGAGLAVVEVAHDGNANSSPEEAEEVAHLILGLLDCEWTDKDGYKRGLYPEDVLVVTPYNAQVREINGALSRHGVLGIQAGTVDKFQGRQAPVVIYSMATSSSEDAPRGLEFLLDMHRLNVATSRAKATAIIVASPDLTRVFCGSPRQMRQANALCRAWELGCPAQ
jgi:uncharacterized protein